MAATQLTFKSLAYDKEIWTKYGNNRYEKEIHWFLVTDMFDEILMPKKYCGRSRCSLVQMMKSYSDALDVDEVGNLLTSHRRRTSHILKHFV